ncbi:MAG: DUF3015 family protein [Bdellovibrionales bacterium]|nr:DUF3015 family protein [Bdellovibrionales bacterium]
MRSIIIGAILLAFPLVSQAKDTMDGCGLGWEVTDSETMIGTTTRGTTNMFVPPAFGMTTGTIGCKQLSFAANEQEAANYVINNYSNLKQELASGEGEYVEGLTEVMGCKNTARIQSQYRTVVAPAQNGVELYKNLKDFCG